MKWVKQTPDILVVTDCLQVDTARTYCGGTSEEYLGKIDWKQKGLKLETKLYPAKVNWA
jgi:aflatoxin B1 aldehyde reductase